MEQGYWLKRQRAALGMARGAEDADTRLIHYELAGRYSIMAAQSVAAAPADQRVALILPPPIGRPCEAGAQEISR